MLIRRYLLALIGLLLPASALLADKGATLKGQIILEGSPPKQIEFDLGRDACCVEAAPKDERWIVGKSGELANVVVSLRVGREDSVSIPEPNQGSSQTKRLTNKDCSFAPRVLLMQVGQTLRIANDDPTTHNVAATFGRNPSLNVVLAPEKARDFLMAKPERKPMPVSCNIHPYMKGYVFVCEHPFVAVTDHNGKFEIGQLPSGNWQFQFWHEGKYLKEGRFSVQGIEYSTDQRGRVRIPLSERGITDLGTIKLSLSK